MSADPADVTAVWLAHSEFHTSNRGVPSVGAAREIKAALNAGYTADDLIRVVRWAHLAPHKLASFLRGPEYEKGESVVGDYLAIPNLMRRVSLDQRIALATEWEAKGSPNFRDAPQSAMTAQDREARIVKVLYQIVEANGNPEATENPKLTRAILDGLYEQGMSVEWIGGVDKDQARWEYPKIARQLMKAADEKRAAKAVNTGGVK